MGRRLHFGYPKPSRSKGPVAGLGCTGLLLLFICGLCGRLAGVGNQNTLNAPTAAPTPAYAISNIATPANANSKPRKESKPSAHSGASALCGDGSLSYSASRRGTCSHHGGVAEWY